MRVRQNPFRPVTAFSFALLFAGCELPLGGGGGKQDPVDETPVEICEAGKDCELQSGPNCFEESHTQGSDSTATNKVDVLFVVDTSGSLVNDLDKIADNLDRFVGALPQDSDARFAVTLAHGPLSPYYGRLFQRSGSGSSFCYNFGGKCRNYCDRLPSKGKVDFPVLGESLGMTRDEVRERLRMKLSSLPTDLASAGGELGLIAARRALHDSRVKLGQSQGFYRKDAALAMIFISDENDICAQYPDGVKPNMGLDFFLEKAANAVYCKKWSLEHAQSKIDFHKKRFKIRFSERYNFLRDIVQRAQDAKGSQPYSFSAIIYTNPNTVPKGFLSQEEVGYGYKEFVEGTNGTLVDLAQANFYNDMDHLGEQVGRTIILKKDFVLSNAERIDVASIRVTVDGQVVEHAYDAETKTVHIEDAGRDGSVVKINYCQLPAPEPTPTPSPTSSPTPEPSPTVTPDPTPSPTPTASPTPTPSPTVSPSPTPSPTTSPSPTPSPTPTVSPTPSPTPTPSPSFPGGCNALDCDGTGI
mgnify:CR=1 FL=1